jgi:hypothetical protein
MNSAISEFFNFVVRHFYFFLILSLDIFIFFIFFIRHFFFFLILSFDIFDLDKNPAFQSSLSGPPCFICSVLTLHTGRNHRNLRTRRRISSQKLTISIVKQGKFKIGVVPADGLGRLLLNFLKNEM